MSEQDYLHRISRHRIAPPAVRGDVSAADLIDQAMLSYNGGRLRELCQVFVRKLLQPDCTVGLAVSGALTPAGLGMSCLIPLIRAGFVDWIVSTGANLYHDTHYALNLPLHQSLPSLNDFELREHNIIRIYDIVFDYKTLLDTDAFYRRLLGSEALARPMGTAELHYEIGKYLHARAAELGGAAGNSVLAAAYECGVPVYTSSPGDSSIGMNVAELALAGSKIQIDTLKDVNETAAIVYHAKRSGGSSGVLILGGGSPKNFMLQTEPQIQEVLGLEESGHDYFLQVTDARPDTGGLSGATPQEAMTWGKVDPDRLPDSVVCYTDSTIALPLLAAYAFARAEERPLKRLYDRREAMLERLRSAYRERVGRGEPAGVAARSVSRGSKAPRIRAIDPDDPERSAGAIGEAAAILAEGGLVAFPTETVYGLGADATNAKAVERIFQAKGRSPTNPLIVHLDGVDRARLCVRAWPEAARRLAERFWPGPLTLVLPRSERIPDLVTAGQETVALRVPNVAAVRALIARAGKPIAAPSANRSGAISPTKAEHVVKSLNINIDIILDGGPTAVGLESTVLDLTTDPPRVLRPGPIGLEALSEALGVEVRFDRATSSHTGAEASPGRSVVHYAPRIPAWSVRAGDPLPLLPDPDRLALVTVGRAFDETALPPARCRIDLPDPETASRSLYEALHRCEDSGAAVLLVVLPPEEPAWLTVLDRLRRATQPANEHK